MSAENFKILKEINSLTIKSREINDLVTKENKRLQFIEDNRAERQDEMAQAEIALENFKKEMLKLENEISTLSNKIDKDKSNRLSLVEDASISSMDKQILDLETKKVKFEESLFEHLENAEEEEKKIAEAQNFLEGSLRSLTEIKKEVLITTGEHQKEIDILSNRLTLLKEGLPAQFQNKLEQVFKNKIQISSFTRIKSNSCEFCRRDISRMEETEVEQKLALKTCQGCGRIFIPAAASL
jgi:predicted  nucleic acid-binding Zn-ribbon protein